eukprot:361808-Chlamydomonas_euryale.AAC.16
MVPGELLCQNRTCMRRFCRRLTQHQFGKVVSPPSKTPHKPWILLFNPAVAVGAAVAVQRPHSP